MYSKHSSRLENWTNTDLGDVSKVLKVPKKELVSFCRTLVGGSWAHLRRQTKEALVCEITGFAQREIRGYIQIKYKDL